MNQSRFSEPSEEDFRIKRMNQVFYVIVGAAFLLIVYYLW